MMQKVQKRSQPSWTFRKARVCPAKVRAPKVETVRSRRALPTTTRATAGSGAVTAATSASRRLSPITWSTAGSAREAAALGVGGVGHRAGVHDHDVGGRAGPDDLAARGPQAIGDGRRV